MAFAKIGSELTVNTTTAGDQTNSSLARLTNGEVIVVWEDTSQLAADGFEIKGQLLAASGTAKTGLELDLNQTTDDDQFDATVVALGNGRFAAGWTSSAPVSEDDLGIRLHNGVLPNYAVTQVFDSGGAAIGGEQTYFLPHSDPANQDSYKQASVTLMSNTEVFSGDFDVYFEETYYGETHVLIFPLLLEWANDKWGSTGLIDGNAAAAGADFELYYAYQQNDSISFVSPVDPPGYTDPERSIPSAGIVLRDGTKVLAFFNTDGPNQYSGALADGARVDFGANGTSTQIGSADGGPPALAALSSGGYIAVWSDTAGAAGGDADIRAHIFDAEGARVGLEFDVNTGAGVQTDPKVAELADGRIVVVWEDRGETANDTSGSAIRAQIITADGERSGERFLINTTTTDDQYAPEVAALDDGNFVVTWTDASGAATNIRSQVIDPRDYDGGAADDVAIGGEDRDIMAGSDGRDTLKGKGGNDTLIGDADNDTLEGNAGDDSLNGGTGADTMAGGRGNDTYVVDNAGDTVTELPGEGAQDQVWTYIDYTLAANVENLLYLGTAASTHVGNGRNNTMRGSTLTDDTISGGEGDDFLYGNGGIDTLRGQQGRDTLDGGSGGDRLEGGQDNDTYYVGAGDLVVEQANEGDNDTVHSTVAHTLRAHVETLVLDGASAIAGSGNGLNNTIIGNNASNRLDGKGGFDILEGQGGSDTYVVGQLATGETDIVVEDLDGGYDAVETAIDGYTLGDNVEQLWLTGAADIDGNGNELANTLSGNEGGNSLSGFEGDDTLVGNGGDDTLVGNGGIDIMIGSAGNDAMTGNGDDDTYFVADAGDTVTEIAGQGYDTVHTTLAAYTLAAEVERLYNDNITAYTGVGNASDNAIYGNNGDDRFRDYNLGIDAFSGGNGTDSMYYSNTTAAILDFATGVHGGSAAGDSFVSIEKFFGSNTGNDTMTAGAGQAIFNGQGGNDTLVGGANLDMLYGLSGADTISGGGGVDSIYGGIDNDTLAGGGQQDYFVYTETAASGGWGADTVTDFVDGTDTIKVSVLAAASIADFAISGNGTAAVTLTLIALPSSTIALNGVAPITVTAADFLFY
jgi:serralysin